MARTYYHDWLAAVREELGLDYRSAVRFYRQLRDQGYGREEFAGFVEALEAVEEEDDRQWFYDVTDAAYAYGLDEWWDSWLAVDEEIEFTVEYED